MFIKKSKEDKGSALVLVLIFVTVFGIWLASSLLVVQVSATEVNKAQRLIGNSSDSARAIAWALTQVQTSPSPLGVAGQNNCDLPSVPSELTGAGITISCTPAVDSGATKSLDTLILMGTDASSGAGGKGSTASAVKSGLTIQGTLGGGKQGGSNQNITFLSGIRNLSGVFDFPGSIVLDVQGNVKVPAGSNCSPKLGSINAKSCSSGSEVLDLTQVPSGSGSKILSSYWKSQINAISTTSGLMPITQAGFPDCTAWNPNATSISVFLKPGIYGTNAVSYLNNLTAGTKLSELKNAYGSPCLNNPNTSAITSISLLMDPGIYYFEGTTSATTTWTVNNPLISIKGSPAGLDSSGACIENSTLTDLQLQANPNGVQIQFGGPNISLVMNNGSFQTCPISYHFLPRLSFVAIDAIAKQYKPNLGKEWVSSDYVLSVSETVQDFKMYGGVYAPDAPISISQNGSGSVEFSNGLITKALLFKVTASTTSPLKVNPPKSINGNRSFELKVKKYNRQISSTTFEVIDNFGQDLNSGFRVLKKN